MLPVERHSPSVAGSVIADCFGLILRGGGGYSCVFPYAQKWYTLDQQGNFVVAADELVSARPDGVPLVLVSADTYPAGENGLWAPTSRTWRMRITNDAAGLSASQAAQLRAQFVDEMVAAGDPTFQRDGATLRTADIFRREVIWPGYVHNAVSLATFLVFGASTRLIVGRAWHAWRTPPGYCLQCQYDRRGTALGSPCPECGTPAPARAGPGST